MIARHYIAIAIALVFMLFLAARVEAIDFTATTLKDLTIDESRIPDWDTLDYLPLSTATWTINTLASCPTSAVLASELAAASEETVIIIPAGCTVVFAATDSALSFRTSRVVIRGANRTTSILQFSRLDTWAIEFGNYFAGSMYGSPRTWTSGFLLGTTVLGVANTTDLIPGEWVQVVTEDPPVNDSSNIHDYQAKLECVVTAAFGSADCSGMSANTVRLDRPLRADYNYPNPTLSPRITANPHHENMGLENLTINHTDPTNIINYRYRLLVYRCHECWITDVTWSNAGNNHINLREASRLLVRGNDFGSNSLNPPGPYEKATIYVNTECHDNVIENNSFAVTPTGIQGQGGSGNIFAYNYFTPPATEICERHLFLHGRGGNSTLLEGNDVSCAVQWDAVRNSQGHYNTFYRNRLRGSDNAYRAICRGRLGPEIASGAYEHRYVQLMLNHAYNIASSPCPGFNAHGADASRSANEVHFNFYAERNITRDAVIILSSTGYSVNTVTDTNVVGTSPPAGWSSDEFPTSLYRTASPDWWCSQSGAFPNIGADFDNSASYSELPAERRLEASACNTDADMDGVFDDVDNCTTSANGSLASTGSCNTQLDGDSDGYGNPCDTDTNNDGATGIDDVIATLTESNAVGTDPNFDFNCDGAVGLDDVIQALRDSDVTAVPGPTGLACAGSVPCPVP